MTRTMDDSKRLKAMEPDPYSHMAKRLMELGSKRSLGIALYFDEYTLKTAIIEASREWSQAKMKELDEAGLQHLGYRR